MLSFGYETGLQAFDLELEHSREERGLLDMLEHLNLDME